MMPNVYAIPFDVVVDRLIDNRTIDQKIHDSLASCIILQELKLEVGHPGYSQMYPPQHVRRVHLTDGYTHVVHFLDTHDYENDTTGYTEYVARKLVMMFAEQRYLRK